MGASLKLYVKLFKYRDIRENVMRRRPSSEMATNVIGGEIRECLY